MKCPVCKDVSLVMSDKQGVEIDYCPNCRGVWLDRGELDKIIERSVSSSNSFSQSNYRPQNNSYREPQRHESYDDRGYHKKKKEGFLSELFDFD